MVHSKIWKFTMLLLAGAVCAAAFTACASKTSSTGNASSSGNELIGKVTAVKGSNITLALGTMGGGQRNFSGSGASGGRQGNMPSGEMPSGGGQGNMPSGGQGDASGGQQGNASGGTSHGGMGGSFGLTLTGKTQTITVINSTTITKMTGFGGRRRDSSGTTSSSASSEDNTATISDISVGTILRVTLENGKAKTIIIMGSQTEKTSSGSTAFSTASASTAAATAESKASESKTTVSV